MRLFPAKQHRSLLSLVAGFAMLLTGCSRKPQYTFEGFVEGKFVYIASPQAGRLTSLSVARGQSIDASHPLFGLDHEPEAAAERQAEQLLRVSQARLADLQIGKTSTGDRSRSGSIAASYLRKAEVHRPAEKL